MENGRVPSGKEPFQLVLYTLFHHKHLIAEDGQCMGVCVHVYLQ